VLQKVNELLARLFSFLVTTSELHLALLTIFRFVLDMAVCCKYRLIFVICFFLGNSPASEF